MQDLQTIESFFNARTLKYGQSVESLDWGSSRTQEIRFAIFSEIASLQNKTILDVGCGFADFFTFLNDTLKLNVDYTGVDISHEIVQKTKELYPKLNILKLDILTQDIKKHDYVFGSGIHNIKVTNNYKLFEAMLVKMFALANCGVATNLVKASDSLAEHIFGYEVQKVHKVVTKISEFNCIREDYLPHDFTLYLYKQDWATRSAYEEK